MTARRIDSTQESPTDSELSVVAGPPLRAEPGLLLIFSNGQPACGLLPLGATPIELGRGQGLLAEHLDSRMSRQHARVSFSENLFQIEDLGSRNGSAIDGVPLCGAAKVSAGQLVRLGHTLFLCCQDLRPFRQFGVKVEPRRVEGPALQQTLRTLAHFAGFSRTLFITGDSGSGKEFIAQCFHRKSPQRDGPFVAVNCAAIPEGVAERLLFGARKGAFSGAVSDSPGYIEAADGGTLFLDEVADLDLVVQGKLLRVIESGELLPLGATRAKKVQFRVCAATHKDLRELTEAGKFRADLYFRIGMPQISVPPLRERREEVPFLITQTVQAAAPDLAVDVSLVETCLLRDWPGNIRELQAEISAAALTARAALKDLLTAAQLRKDAGAIMQRAQEPKRITGAHTPLSLPGPLESPALLPKSALADPIPSAVAGAPLPVEIPPPAEPPSRAQILAALLATDFNVAATARSLSLHRTQLRRLLVRYSIDVSKLHVVGKGSG